MTLLARVTQLLRYPVKSMGAESLKMADVVVSGIVGDRAWGVFDADSGRLLSAKTVPQLLMASAVYRVDTHVDIVLPTGATSSDQNDCNEMLSAWLGRGVELRRPSDGVRSTIDIDVDLSFHGGVGDTVMDFESPAGAFVDSSPLHLLSTASLAAAKALYPEGVWTVDRFRPNVVVDGTGDEGFAEDGWVGRRVDVGSVGIAIRKRTQRCVITTRANPSAPTDRKILRTLHAHHGADLGVSALVSAAGAITVGELLTMA